MTTLARPPVVQRVGGRVIAAFAAVYVIWGSTYLFIRIAGETIPPLLMAGLRFLVAGGLLYAVTRRMGGGAEDPVGPRQWRAAAIAGALLLAGGNGLVSYGEEFVPSGIVALLVGTVPLFIALFAGLFLGQRLRPLAMAGIAVGLIGTGLLLRPGGGSGGDTAHMFLVLLAPLSWAAGSLYSTRAPLPRRPLVATAIEMLCGGVLLVAFAAVTGELNGFHPAQVTVAAWLSVLYLVVFGSIVAFTCYVWLLGTVSTTAVATYAYVNPVVAVALGALFLQERITVQTLVAAAIILSAVALILARPPTAPRAAAALPEAQAR
jgi:drug/metabolite transporter (DMT)-like permease